MAEEKVLENVEVIVQWEDKTEEIVTCTKGTDAIVRPGRGDGDESHVTFQKTGKSKDGKPIYAQV
jgi:hypothetical protein